MGVGSQVFLLAPPSDRPQSTAVSAGRVPTSPRGRCGPWVDGNQRCLWGTPGGGACSSGEGPTASHQLREMAGRGLVPRRPHPEPHPRSRASLEGWGPQQGPAQAAAPLKSVPNTSGAAGPLLPDPVHEGRLGGPRGLGDPRRSWRGHHASEIVLRLRRQPSVLPEVWPRPVSGCDGRVTSSSEGPGRAPGGRLPLLGARAEASPSGPASYSLEPPSVPSCLRGSEPLPSECPRAALPSLHLRARRGPWHPGAVEISAWLLRPLRGARGSSELRRAPCSTVKAALRAQETVRS